jgi:transmembrane sensor
VTDLAHPFESLGDYVRAEQDLRLEADHSLGAVRLRFLEAERRPGSKRRFVRATLLVAAALGALGAVLLGMRLLRPAPLVVTTDNDHHTVAVGDWIRVRQAAIPLAFSDGTSITLDPGSRARLEAVDASGARLTIETGHADVRVVPGREGRWHLNLGPFGVDVTGTQFDIGWNPESEELSLTMREGKVMVSGCALGDGRPLVAGERLTASCRDRSFEVVPAKTEVASNFAPTPASAEAPSPELGATALSPAARADNAPSLAHADASAMAPDSWQALARAGKYKAALGAANDLGFDLEVGRSSAEDLSLLGDVARFGGSIDESIKAYLTLRRRFPHTPLSANAAFAIGRMQFDQRHAFAEAERWFANYLTEQPHGPLAREALGRRMEALDRSGNLEAARVVATSYRKGYPRGPHIHLAERLLETR